MRKSDLTQYHFLPPPHFVFLFVGFVDAEQTLFISIRKFFPCHIRFFDRTPLFPYIDSMAGMKYEVSMRRDDKPFSILQTILFFPFSPVSSPFDIVPNAGYYKSYSNRYAEANHIRA